MPKPSLNRLFIKLLPFAYCIGLAAPLLFLASCGTRTLKDRSQALRISRSVPELSDDLGYIDLLAALESQIKFLKSSEAKRFPTLQFGERSIAREVYADSLQKLINLTKAAPQPETALFESIKQNFDFLEVYGDRKWGDVFMTSYYEPLIAGAREPRANLTQALYKTPPDAVEVQLSRFSNLTDPGKKSVIARLSNEKNASGLPLITPYWTRKEIDQDQKLAKQNLELIYVDPIDAFFLHIQGSGSIEFDDKSQIRVGYAAQNGHKYDAIGSFLFDVIPREKITAHTIEQHVRALSPDKQHEILNKNASYIFFKILSEPAITFMGIPAIAGRTLATDSRFFPKGALGFLKFEKPIFPSAEAIEPSEWRSVSRFVFDHDKGGAINGGGRLDLFWGRGAEAKQSSGVIKNRGTLWYLFPKEAFLK